MRRRDYYGFRSQQKRARRQSGLKGSIRLGVLFAVLVGINVYVFFFRGGTSIQDILKASAINKKQPAAAAGSSSGSTSVTPSEQPAKLDDSILLQGTMQGQAGLLAALLAQKVDGGEAAKLINALKGKLDMRALQPRHAFEVHLDPATGRIRRFVYKLSPINQVVAKRDSAGGFKAERKLAKLKVKTVRFGVRVAGSLSQAIAGQGEKSALGAAIVRLLSWDINWYADPRDGDQVRAIFEKKFLKGKFYRYGKVLAAEYRTSEGRRYQVFFHKSKGGAEGHYDVGGRSVKREFLRTPLNYKRISSGFNRSRFHPVLHRTKGHKGVDYAADIGTPVFAVADGRIVKIGRYGGAGKMVRLSHKNGIMTEYLHLSRFERGQKVGTKVRQRQCVGYVGTTGLSSGPHLHYGVKVRGRYVDPLRFGVGRGKGPLLPRRERNRYLDDLPDRRAALESIPIR